jgi:capsular polysaccharide transport system permease protein
MSVEPITSPVRVPASQRAQKVSESLSEAARRLRFSTGGRSLAPTTHRARRNQRVARFVTFFSFLALVAIPTVLSTAYFALIAADQYVAEARFAVRSGAMAGVDALSSMTGMPSVQVNPGHSSCNELHESRALVDCSLIGRTCGPGTALQKQLLLRALTREAHSSGSSSTGMG